MSELWQFHYREKTYAASSNDGKHLGSAANKYRLVRSALCGSSLSAAYHIDQGAFQGKSFVVLILIVGEKLNLDRVGLIFDFVTLV